MRINKMNNVKVSNQWKKRQRKIDSLDEDI